MFSSVVAMKVVGGKEAGGVCTTLLIAQLHNQPPQKWSRRRNYETALNALLQNQKSQPSNKPPTHCSSPAPTLDKDLDDISCGGQSPWDAIIGGSSDHYAAAHTISRTQYTHNMFAYYKKWIIIPTEWRT